MCFWCVRLLPGSLQLCTFTPFRCVFAGFVAQHPESAASSHQDALDLDRGLNAVAKPGPRLHEGGFLGCVRSCSPVPTRTGGFHRCVRAPPLDGDIEQPAGVAAAGELSGGGWMSPPGGILSFGGVRSCSCSFGAALGGWFVFVTEAFVKKCPRNKTNAAFDDP